MGWGWGMKQKGNPSVDICNIVISCLMSSQVMCVVSLKINPCGDWQALALRMQDAVCQVSFAL